ncbi:MAG: NFACT RNA binding domain-containing protein [Thermacetogeniaceae bacterium]|nr:fibronectin/fibrinogen-binding protein [Syntrophomonadaceae bacterium]
MSPDGVTLNLIVKELQEILIPARVERIYQPEKQEIVLNLRSSRKSRQLLISAQAENARLHLTTQEKKNPLTPPLFCAVLRKYLEGSRLTSIKQKGLDRVVNLSFSRIAESGEFQDVVLVVEIMGKHSNIILLDPSNRIIDGIKRYSHALSRYREVLPGHEYVAPPSQKKVHPLDLSEDRFFQLMTDQPLEKSLEEILFQRIEGLSPVLAKEVVLQAGIEPELRLEYCGEHELRSLWLSILNFLFPLLNGKMLDPVVVYQEKQPAFYAPCPFIQYHGLTQAHYSSVNEALDKFYQTRLEINTFQQSKAHLSALIKNELSRLNKKLLAQEQDEADAQKAMNYRLQGEMILAHLHTIDKGAREVTLPNLYEPGSPPINVILDPSLSAVQNAQRLFHKYNKARDTLKILQKHKKDTTAEIRYLSTVQFALEQADSLKELHEIQAELMEAGYLASKEKNKHKKKVQKKEAPQIKQIISQDGFTILIGKNNKQNDYLTMRLAKDEDYWLHAKESAGAHVVVKSKPGQEIPPTTLEEAAGLAAYFSEARHSSKVPVDCTKRKNVSKPTGARPGFVIYKNYETFYVAPKAPE